MAKRDSVFGSVVVFGALAAGAYYLFFRKPAGATAPAAAATTADKAARPLGDPSDPNSVAWACNTGWKLTALGHPTEAAPWIQRCQAGGGTVPQNATQQYT